MKMKVLGWSAFLAYVGLVYLSELYHWGERVSFGQWVAISVFISVAFMAITLDLDCTRKYKRFFTETYEEKMARKAKEAAERRA